MKTKMFILKTPVLMICFMVLLVSVKAQTNKLSQQKSRTSHQKHVTKTHPLDATINASDNAPVPVKNNDRAIKDSILNNYKF